MNLVNLDDNNVRSPVIIVAKTVVPIADWQVSQYGSPFGKRDTKDGLFAPHKSLVVGMSQS